MSISKFFKSKELGIFLKTIIVILGSLLWLSLSLQFWN